LPLSIPELQPNDKVTIRDSNGNVTDVFVSSVAKGKLDYENQPFFIDTNGEIHWSGRSVILDTTRTEPKAKPQKPTDGRNWREQITLHPDGTPKTMKEILLSREDGKTFEDEVRGIVDGSKENALDAVNLARSTVLWFPRQFPKIDTFDLRNDPRSDTLIGYRAEGVNEVEKFRLFRTGSVVKLVDNGEGKLPRRFGRRYVTYFGVGLIILPVLAVISVIIGAF